jgi:hypothetical protein
VKFPPSLRSYSLPSTQYLADARGGGRHFETIPLQASRVLQSSPEACGRPAGGLWWCIRQEDDPHCKNLPDAPLSVVYCPFATGRPTSPGRWGARRPQTAWELGFTAWLLRRHVGCPGVDLWVIVIRHVALVRRTAERVPNAGRPPSKMRFTERTLTRGWSATDLPVTSDTLADDSTRRYGARDRHQAERNGSR